MKQLYIWCYWLLAFSYLPLNSHAQEARFQRIGLKEGLSQSTVNTISQDQKGFMWFGTQDGLNRYDGYSFVQFKHDLADKNSIAGNHVSHACTDTLGGLWLSIVNAGLDHYLPKQDLFLHYNARKGDTTGITSNEILGLYSGQQGIWIANAQGGLNLVDVATGNITNKYNCSEKLKPLFEESYKALLEHNGILWFVRHSNFIGSFDLEKQEFVSLIDPITVVQLGTSTNINIIRSDKQGNIWFGTSQAGAYSFNPTTKMLLRFNLSQSGYMHIPNNFVRDITEDAKGNVWIATFGGLTRLNHINNTNTTYYHNALKETSIPENITINLFVDRTGVVWIGTENAGLAKHDPLASKFLHIRHRPEAETSLSSNAVRPIIEDTNGNVWIGTFGGGLNMLDKHTGQYTHYNHNPQDRENSIASDYLFALHEDKRGNIWVGTWDNGISRIDPVNKTTAHYKHDPIFPFSLSNSSITSFAEDKNGNIWVGTHGGGLNMLNPAVGMFIRFQYNTGAPNKGISDNVVWDILLSKNDANILWIATGRGLNKLNLETKELKQYLHDPDKPESLSYNEILSIHEDEEGFLWLGTNGGGMNMFDPLAETFKAWNEKSGLPNNVVYGVLGDSQSKIWMSTNKGLSCFNPVDKSFRNYDVNDGLQSNEFNACSYAQGQISGNMYFGGVNGLNVFDPTLVIDNPHVPEVTIISFQIFNEDVPICKYDSLNDPQINDDKMGLIKRDGNSFLRSTPAYLKNLILSYKDDVVSFGFAGLHYSFPKKNKYAYKLKGFESAWNYVNSDRRFATYTNLDAGTYTFQVKATNADGVWSPTGTEITLVVNPPFWQTWWFRIAAVLSIIVLVIGYVKRREAKLRQQKEILEQKVRERTAQLQQKNEEITIQNEEIRAQKEEIERQNTELEKLSIVASKTDNAVIIMDSKGNFEWVNDGFTRMFGQTLAQLTHNVSVNIIGTKTPDHVRELVTHAIEHKKTVNYELEINHANGSKVWIQTTLTPILDDDGEVIKLVAIDSDINALKEAEAEIHQQKEEIEAQKEEIENQRDIAIKAKDAVTEQKKEIEDSIHYAKRIQNAILPREQLISEYLPNHFILFRPRDIVSGDFYWMAHKNGKTVITAADCTGHGVPGAFMSMLGVASLNEIVNKNAEISAELILNQLRDYIIKSLQQTGKSGEAQDGMDISLCIIDHDNMTLEFAGANNPLVIIRDNELLLTKGDKMPIGIHRLVDRKFSQTVIPLQPNDVFYVFSDGFPDQFGGEKGRKYMSKNFKNKLLEIHQAPMNEQRDMLEAEILSWMGSKYKQIDDQLVIGVRI